MINNPTPYKIVRLVVKWPVAICRTEPWFRRYILKSISRYRGYCVYFTINFSFWQAALKYVKWLPCFLNWLWFCGSRFQNGGFAGKFPKKKIAFLHSVHKYANCVDPKRHMTFHSGNVELSVKYFVIWAKFVGKLIGDHFILEKKNRSSLKISLLCFIANFDSYQIYQFKWIFCAWSPKGRQQHIKISQ